ncbi:MAG: gliding motility-associated C-terminal domain-containing protein [Cytophagia bacterium]|nr:MAG: gliding motility-associated C-terminal domain-containing protein [Cytophagia bacterium]TAG37743.1 MAG: gliding motility-associated C-terminal domain-containing protein [Cytophagia bacterium]
MKKIYIFLFLLVFSIQVKAQLVINPGGGVPGINAATVIQQMTGQGVSINPATVSLIGGNRPSYGKFKRGIPTQAGFTQLPIDSGMVISSGQVADGFRTATPNSTFFADGNWSALSGVSEDDPDLTAILTAAGVPSATFDRAGIEFQITPIGDKIFFKYTLASEEYQAFSNPTAGFVDAFAFLVTGPNPVTGQPAYDKRNIALIPGTSTPVSIRSINQTTNTAFYQSNSVGNTSNTLGTYAFSYGGFTKDLVASIDVIPCQTYTLRLLVADVGDRRFDTAVFIEQVNSNVPTFSANLSPSLGGIMEGCARVPITITRAFTNSAEIFQLQQGTLGAGIAEFGLDYDIEFNGSNITALPLSLNFAIGETTKTLFLIPKNDVLPEGTETFTLRLMTNCTPSIQISSMTGSILDATNLQPINNVPIITGGPSLVYRCKTTDDVIFTCRDAETYTWTSTDGTFTCLTPDCKQIKTNTINTEATYNVTIKIGTCTFTQSVKVIPSFLVVTPSTPPTLCINQTTTLVASGMDSYTWSPATNLSCTNCANPTFTANAGAVTTIYTVTGIKGTCTNTQQVTINVTPQTAPTITMANSYCVNALPVPLVANPTGGTFSIAGNTATQFDPAALGVGTHIITYSIGGAGCATTTTKSVDVIALPVLTWGSTWKSNYCVSEAAFTLAGTANPIGGAFNVNGSLATSFNPTTLGTGTHSVIYTYTNPTTNCTNTLTRSIVVNPLPILNITGLNAVYCLGATAVNLIGTPAGGSFTVNGNTNTQFDPFVLGVGTHNVIYTYTDANTCTNTKTQSVSVINLPTLTNNVKESYCLSSPTVTMTGTPGGTFTINGTTATTLNPAILGVGTYTVVQNYNDPASGCSNTLSKTVVINVKPTLNIVGLNTFYCVNSPIVNLSATPIGGTFTINNITATNFNPATLGVGNHTVKYNYVSPTDAGCFNDITQIVEVKALPILSFSNLNNAYCVSASNTTLTATPTGGIFTINGTIGTDFSPNTLGAGNHIVVYSFTDVNSCTNTITKTVTVNSLPIISNNVGTSYCLSSPAFNMVATPTGGTFTINGVSATQFNPTTLGLGTYTVIQSFTDANGCSNTLSKTVTINTRPTLSFVGLQTEYCIDAQIFSLQATPTGGTFTINGTAATDFNATALGAGNYTIKYNYVSPTDAGCFNDITQVVKVNPKPILEIQNVNNGYCVSYTLAVTPNIKITLANGTIQNQNLASFVPSTVGVGNQTLTFSFTDPNTGCQNTITKTVAINPLPILSFGNVPDEYCSQAVPLIMTANPAGGVFSINGTPSGTLNPTLYAVNQVLTITYTYTDNNTCSNTITKTVKIVEPSTFTEEEIELKICPPPTGYPLEALTLAEEQAYIAAGKILTYSWSGNVTTFRFFSVRGDADAGVYNVQVKDQSGCPLKKIQFTVQVSCEPSLFLPTAFSPNGDGLNDVWEIFGEDFSKLDLKVYNRWGEVVFVAYERGDKWDGTRYGLKAPDGIYNWKATYENILQKRQKITKMGAVTIIR